MPKGIILAKRNLHRMEKIWFSVDIDTATPLLSKLNFNLDYDAKCTRKMTENLDQKQQKGENSPSIETLYA
jgi:hypothetical protein